MHFLDRCATQCTKLKEMSVTTVGHGPGESAIDEKDGASRFQAFINKTAVGTAKSEFFKAEITHATDHQSILHGILHMMELQIGVVIQHEASRVPPPFELLDGTIRMHVGTADWH
jgi:hypothetical protein